MEGLPISTNRVGFISSVINLTEVFDNITLSISKKYPNSIMVSNLGQGMIFE